MCRFKDKGWTRVSSRGGMLLWVRCSQAYNNWIKKSSLFCFCKFLWLLDLQESFFVEKGLVLDQNSGLISVNTVWDLSREHWWYLITFESILFLSCLLVRLSKTVTYLVCPSKWRVELSILGWIISCSRGNCIFFFQFPFWYFGIV